MFHTPGDVRWFKASAAVRTVDKVLKGSMMDHVLMHFFLSCICSQWRYGPNAVAVVASKNLLVLMVRILFLVLLISNQNSILFN